MERAHKNEKGADDGGGRNEGHGRSGAPQAKPAVSIGRLLIFAAVFLLGMLIGALGLHYGLERPALDAAHAQITRYEQDMAAMRGHLTKAESTVAALEGRLHVEEGTRRGLYTSLQTLQSELGRAHDTIAFYEQLMPPGPKGSISIRALDIERAGPNLRYRLLLMRSGAGDSAFTGSLQFVAQGQVAGEEVQVELKPATIEAVSQPPTDEADPADDEPLSLEFVDFQRSSGLLGLPEGFVPHQVTVNVLEGQTLRTSREYDLPATE